jgi:hypothetical protein
VSVGALRRRWWRRTPKRILRISLALRAGPGRMLRGPRVQRSREARRLWCVFGLSRALRGSPGVCGRDRPAPRANGGWLPLLARPKQANVCRHPVAAWYWLGVDHMDGCRGGLVQRLAVGAGPRLSDQPVSRGRVDAGAGTNVVSCGLPTGFAAQSLDEERELRLDPFGYVAVLLWFHEPVQDAPCSQRAVKPSGGPCLW